MSVESTRATMMRYFSSDHGDTSMLAEDVVFTIMSTGQEHRGRAGVMGNASGLEELARLAGQLRDGLMKLSK